MMETNERLLGVGIAVLLVAGGLSGYTLFNMCSSDDSPKRFEYTISRLPRTPFGKDRIATWTAGTSIKFELNFSCYMIPERGLEEYLVANMSKEGHDITITTVYNNSTHAARGIDKYCLQGTINCLELGSYTIRFYFINKYILEDSENWGTRTLTV